MSREIRDKLWDVIVIGTGVGGGVLGRRLAEKGLSVLFVERGPNGPRGEETALDGEMFDPVARQVRGFWPDPIKAQVNGRSSEFFAPLGAGVGGSSVFYAATLERPERHDLDDRADRVHPTGGWPVGFDAFMPYFDQAEKQFHICGEEDPLSEEAASTLAAPPAPEAGDARMMQGFSDAGLHPYRAHMAARFLPECKQCFGFKCPRKCKMDGRSAGVEPALETGNATLIDNCEVLALHSTVDTVSHVQVRRAGKVFDLRAKRYVLAAGALSSPRLLLASTSKHWPKGLANNSGLVGCNLMFHVNEMFAIWPKRGQGFKGASKAIALRDFYFQGGQRFGVVQALGLDASYGEIVHYLNMMFDRSFLARLKPLRNLTRIPAFLAGKLFGSAKVFVGILEDMPYANNRVVLEPDNPSKISIQYRFENELLKRRRQFRRLIKRGFRGQRLAFLGIQPELNFGHPSGTLCFGNDPDRSVLNADCRAHGVKNLFAADASFMPTSMGINPSLTIAANALRVADRMLADKESGDGPD
ncbi:MAG: GMC family oxidoreductase [Rhodobacteraceae bacterium]|nr:GMC family oxidoreductase [Paracoccaceae bacterium]